MSSVISSDLVVYTAQNIIVARTASKSPSSGWLLIRKGIEALKGMVELFAVAFDNIVELFSNKKFLITSILFIFEFLFN